MKNLPTMISTKDILYICDMFNWHLIAAKKFEQYMTQITDKTCQKKVSNLCQMHYGVCQNLIDLLESGAK